MTDTAKPAVPFTELKRALVYQDGMPVQVDVIAFTFVAETPEIMFFTGAGRARWHYNTPSDLLGYFVQLGTPRVVWYTFRREGYELLPVCAVVEMDLIPLES